MTVRKRNHREIRVFASRRWIDSDEKPRIECDVERNRFIEHLFQKWLLEALVDTVEGHTTHLGINEVRTVAHDNFQPAMLVGILPSWNQMLHVQTADGFFS